MPLVGIEIDGGRYTFDEALEIARTGAFPLPYPIVAAVVDIIRQRDLERDPTQISVTDLTGCPRAKVIKILDSYFYDFERVMSVFRGIITHDILAKYAANNTVVETRVSREYRGYTLYGTPDSVVIRESGRYRLIDFKTTKRVPLYSPYSNHIVQVNLYRYILGIPPSDVDIDIVYIALDDARVVSKRLREKQVWSDHEVEGFLDNYFIPLAKAVELLEVIPISAVSESVLSWACGYCPVIRECLRRARNEGDAAVAKVVAAANSVKQADLETS